MALLLILVRLLWFVSAAAASSESPRKDDCQRSCGQVPDIPYPFGIGDKTCFRNEGFKLSCRDSQLSWRDDSGRDIEIRNISLLEGQMTANASVSYDCYDNNGKRSESNYSNAINLPEDGPYTFSNTRNQFTAVGCDTLACMDVYKGNSRIGNGCATTCFGYENTSTPDGTCSGMGCCQFKIPPGVKEYHVKMSTFYNYAFAGDFNTCGYSFLGDPDRFKFSLDYLRGIIPEPMPTVLDWVAGMETTCEEAKKAEDYACLSENSACYVSNNGPGYRCNCSRGYEGNPYISHGCKDIDECDHKDEYPCDGNCHNIAGGYRCTCPTGTLGKDGMNCSPVLSISFGVGLGLLFLLMGSTLTYWIWRKRKSIKLKKKFFHQNGGFILRQKISTRGAETFKIFTLEELERATNNYNSSNIVGQGGSGVVYKGVLSDNRTVAIKRSILVDASQTEQFVNELDILSQINHRNVVKLLGCCLENQVPILVYEFIANKTLYYHIHEAGDVASISLDNRLRIAVETAEALAYLHSAASMPVLHRDIKSANILLDDNFTAKVADFGLSRLVPIDQTHISTMVLGTLGYLDPEYFQTGYLTSKSDVYSFGVVLVELLTGEKPVFSNRSQEERSLVMYFLNAMKENRLFQVLEERIRSDGPEELFMAIARLAKRCLKFKGEDRPTMKDVVVELQGLRRFQEPVLFINEDEETQSLLGGTSLSYTGDAGGKYSSENQMVSVIDIGR